MVGGCLGALPSGGALGIDQGQDAARGPDADCRPCGHNLERINEWCSRIKLRCVRCDITDARLKKSARELPPPRGGGCGHEWDVHAWQKTSGRGRDGGSTAGCRRNKRYLSPTTSESNLLRTGHVQASIDGTPQYSPHRPFHSLPRHNPRTFSFRRAAPPSRRGGCLRTSHSAHIAPRFNHHHPQPQKSPKNQFS